MLRTVDHCRPRAVGRHGAGDARRQHVGGRDRQAVDVGGRDRRRRRDLGRRALRVGQVGLADLLADGDDDALPADHGAEPERDRDRDLHPDRNELGRVVERALVGVERGDLAGIELGFLVLRQEAKRFGHQIHVVAGVADGFRRNLGQRAVFADLLGDVAHQHGERGIGAFVDLTCGDIVGHGRARVAEDLVTAGLGCDDLARGVRVLDEGLDLARGHRAVQRIGGRHGADQDQHDQAHALLAVVRAVEEADQRAGEDQDAADPQRRRLVA